MMYLRLSFCVFALSFFTSALASAQFIKAMPDIPLMSGLTEIAAEDLSFDKAEGRIAQALLHSTDSLTWQEVETFYINTLPHLGWRVKGQNVWVRRGESLSLVAIKSDPESGLWLHIRIAPIKH